MITTLTIRNLKSNLGRFAMTTFGVVIAVSFVVSSFVLADGLRQTFEDLTTEIVSGTDLEVRPVEEFGSIDSLTEADVSAVREVDGVLQAVGFAEATENSVRPITPTGEEIPTNGPPQLAFGWTDVTALSAFTLVEGTAPAVDQFVLDVDSATRHGFITGETYTVITATGRHELTLSGLTRFGEQNATLGATLTAINADQTDELFGTVGFSSIAVSLTESARADLASAQEAVRMAVPNLDVLTQATIADETAAEFNRNIDLVQYVLLGFAGVSVLVSVFIIGNTFAIVLQQRTREMGLLRLIGADARQLRRGALAEAGVIGALASVLGICGGIAVAIGLTALFDAIGVTLPEYDIAIPIRTVAVAFGLGLGVTLVAAWWPTRVATRVPALAAQRLDPGRSVHSSRPRLAAGALVGLVGVALAVIGAVGADSTSSSAATALTMMGVGALAIFIAVTLLSPALVAPVSTAFGAVLGRFGAPGQLAARNASRQATRTATTATALMIGLAVVSMALIVGQSIKDQIGSNLEETVLADYLLTDQQSAAGFPNVIVDEIAADPTFGAVTGLRTSEISIDDSIENATAAHFTDLPQVFDLNVSDGLIEPGPGALLVSRDRAELDGLTVGSAVDVTLSNGVTAGLVVVGIFDDDVIVTTDFLVDISLFDDNGVRASDTGIGFTIADDVGPEDATAAIDALGDRFPQGNLETAAEFRERTAGLIDGILSVLNALVTLAVIIALIGIANTLALSVSERTREIGLLRAVGMSSRGVRRMIRWEAAVIAGFGAVLGISMGIAFGWLTVQALPATFASSLAIPFGQIIVLLLVASIAGVLAAVFPAWRAGRMNVLDAISST